MGKMKDNETRQRIVEAAMALFREKGMDGMSMRELADAAGVNKGLLHYYFKTKEVLFREVFGHQVEMLYREVGSLLETPGPLRDKVPVLVDGYFRMLERVPGLPAFVLFEMQRDPSILLKTAVRDILFKVIGTVEPELKSMGLPPERASGVHFVMDIVALCAFTFGTLPGISKAMKLNKAQQTAYLESRRVHIITIIQQGLKP
jgi:TetR/AcrR family transcriptional regulator